MDSNERRASQNNWPNVLIQTEKEIFEISERINKVETLRHNDGNLDLKVIKVIPPEKLNMIASKISFIDRIIRKKELETAITENMKTYLYLENYNLDRLKTKQAGISKSIESLNQFRTIKNNYSEIIWRDTNSIKNFLTKLSTIRENFPSYLNKWTSEYTPTCEKYTMDEIESEVSEILEYKERKENEAKNNASYLIDQIEHSFESALNYPKRFDSLTETINVPSYKNNINILINWLNNNSDDAPTCVERLETLLKKLPELINNFEGQKEKCEKYRETREKDKTTLKQMLEEDNLSRDNQKEITKILERYPLMGIKTMSTEEYIDQIKEYSRGLAFHTSSLFAPNERNPESKPEDKFWGAFRQKLLMSYFAAINRGLPINRNAAGSNSIHFAINHIEDYSKTEITRTNSMEIVAVAPVEGLYRVGNLYKGGLEKQIAEGQIGIEKDWEVTGFFTEKESDYSHSSNEIPIENFIFLMPSGYWIKPSSGQVGERRRDREPEGAISAEKFFERWNSMRKQSGQPEIKVVFVPRNSEIVGKCNSIVYPWLKDSGIENPNYDNEAKTPICTLSPKEKLSYIPRYQCDLFQRYASEANSFCWLDIDPEFDEVLSAARDRLHKCD